MKEGFVGRSQHIAAGQTYPPDFGQYYGDANQKPGEQQRQRHEESERMRVGDRVVFIYDEPELDLAAGTRGT